MMVITFSISIILWAVLPTFDPDQSSDIVERDFRSINNIISSNLKKENVTQTIVFNYYIFSIYACVSMCFSNVTTVITNE